MGAITNQAKLTDGYIPVADELLPISKGVVSDRGMHVPDLDLIDAFNAMPTMVGYTSFFGKSSTIGVDAITDNVQEIISYRTFNGNTIFLALCDAGLWVKAAAGDATATVTPTATEITIDLINDEDMEWTKVLITTATNPWKLWTKALLKNFIYLYQKGLGKILRVRSTQYGQVIIDLLDPTFIIGTGKTHTIVIHAEDYWDGDDTYKEFTLNLDGSPVVYHRTPLGNSALTSAAAFEWERKFSASGLFAVTIDETSRIEVPAISTFRLPGKVTNVGASVNGPRSSITAGFSDQYGEDTIRVFKLTENGIDPSYSGSLPGTAPIFQLSFDGITVARDLTKTEIDGAFDKNDDLMYASCNVNYHNSWGSAPVIVVDNKMRVVLAGPYDDFFGWVIIRGDDDFFKDLGYSLKFCEHQDDTGNTYILRDYFTIEEVTGDIYNLPNGRGFDMLQEGEGVDIRFIIDFDPDWLLAGSGDVVNFDYDLKADPDDIDDQMEHLIGEFKRNAIPYTFDGVKEVERFSETSLRVVMRYNTLKLVDFGTIEWQAANANQRVHSVEIYQRSDHLDARWSSGDFNIAANAYDYSEFSSFGMTMDISSADTFTITVDSVDYDIVIAVGEAYATATEKVYDALCDIFDAHGTDIKLIQFSTERSTGPERVSMKLTFYSKVTWAFSVNWTLSNVNPQTLYYDPDHGSYYSDFTGAIDTLADGDVVQIFIYDKLRSVTAVTTAEYDEWVLGDSSNYLKRATEELFGDDDDFELIWIIQESLNAGGFYEVLYKHRELQTPGAALNKSLLVYYFEGNADMLYFALGGAPTVEAKADWLPGLRPVGSATYSDINVTAFLAGDNTLASIWFDYEPPDEDLFISVPPDGYTFSLLKSEDADDLMDVIENNLPVVSTVDTQVSECDTDYDITLRMSLVDDTIVPSILLNQDGTTLWSADPLTNVNDQLAPVEGIFSARGRLGAWQYDNTINWSAATNPIDFIPSKTTQANQLTVNAVLGNIVHCLGYENGFIIYATGNVVQGEYEGGQFVFTFDAVNEAGGAIDPRHVTGDLNKHFYWSQEGLTWIAPDKPEAKRVAGDFTDWINTYRYPITIRMLGSRYLVLHLQNKHDVYNLRAERIGDTPSAVNRGLVAKAWDPPANIDFDNTIFGLNLFPTYVRALVYDTLLAKWGTCDIPHTALWSINPINQQGFPTEKDYNLADEKLHNMVSGIAVLQSDGKSYLADEHPTDSYVLFGKYATHRVKKTKLVRVITEFEAIPSAKVQIEVANDSEDEARISSVFNGDAISSIKHQQGLNLAGHWFNILVRGTHYRLKRLVTRGYNYGRGYR